MIYVLDTDILVLFQEGHPVVCQRVLGHGGTSVTRNATDFEPIPGLTIEDWTA